MEYTLQIYNNIIKAFGEVNGIEGYYRYNITGQKDSIDNVIKQYNKDNTNILLKKICTLNKYQKTEVIIDFPLSIHTQDIIYNNINNQRKEYPNIIFKYKYEDILLEYRI